jgi:hypothetical protein
MGLMGFPGLPGPAGATGPQGPPGEIDAEQLEALEAAIATKASQSDLGAYALTASLPAQRNVAGGFPVLGNGYVRALQAVAPLKIAPDTQFLQIRLDQAELAATPQIAALQTAVATKQNTLGIGVVQGGHPLIQDGTIKAVRGTAPVRVTSTATHVDVEMDESYFGAITAIADEAASKQAQLTAGSSLVFHEKLLDGTKVKSLAPGAGVELNSTGDLVTIAVSPNLAVSSLTPPASTLSRRRAAGLWPDPAAGPCGFWP